MARGWKRPVEYVLANPIATRLAHRLWAPSTAILAYHNVVPDGEEAAGDLSLHVDQAEFGRQLDLVSETHRIVSLSTLLDADATSHVAVVTFDDAYAGAMTAGLTELAKRGFPSTVFVAPGLLGLPGFWWDVLAEKDAGLGDSLREHALVRCAGSQDLVLVWAASTGLVAQTMPEHARPVDAESLVRAAESYSLTLGAHTWSHPNLTAIDAADLAAELVRPLEWLRQRTSRVADWLAFPYGLSGVRETAAAAETYRGAVRVSGGLAMKRGRRRHTRSRASTFLEG